LIASISLIIAIIAIYFAKKADRKAGRANEIANNHRIDDSMPDITIKSIKARISLFSKLLYILKISSVDRNLNNLAGFVLNGMHKIDGNKLIQKIKLNFIIHNSSSNSGNILLDINDIGEQELNICGMTTSEEITFEKEIDVFSIEIANEVINGAKKILFRLRSSGVDKCSYDEIEGSFQIPYDIDHNSNKYFEISDYEAKKKDRVYGY